MKKTENKEQLLKEATDRELLEELLKRGAKANGTEKMPKWAENLLKPMEEVREKWETAAEADMEKTFGAST